MAKLNLSELTDEELLDKITGSTITFSGYLSDSEQTARVLSRPTIHVNERGRFIRFNSEAGSRFIQLEKITQYRKR